MSKGSITGIVGQVKWSYYIAAAIHGYTVTRDGATWRLRGSVVQSDPFKMSQKPLLFVAPHQHGEWRWPIRDLQITDGQLIADLGPPEIPA